MNLTQAFEQARQIGKQARLSISIASNQSNGLVGYATGDLVYYPEREDPKSKLGLPIAEHFSTGDDTPSLEIEITPVVPNKPGLGGIKHWDDANLPAVIETPIVGGVPLLHYFSDRQIDLNKLCPPSEKPPFGTLKQPQPFFARSTDKLGVTLSGTKKPRAKLTLHSWDNATFRVDFREESGVLIGEVAPIEGKAVEVIYLVTLRSVWSMPLGPG